MADTTSSKSIKVLIVEDEEMLRDMYSTAFQIQGITPALADDGITGLEAVKSHKPDIILLDVMMPNMNGMEMLEKLKANAETKDIPVVILSNLAEENSIQQAKKLGAINYMIKSDYVPEQIVNYTKQAVRGEV